MMSGSAKDLEENGPDSRAYTCCPNNETTFLDTYHKNILRIFGFLTLIVGLVEVGIGAAVFDFLSDFIQEGSWWAGMV